MDVTRSEVVPASIRLLADGSPVTGATIVLDIQRASDGLVVDWSDDTLKALGSVSQRYLSVSQISATDWPGTYRTEVDLGAVGGIVDNPPVGDTLIVTFYEQTAGPVYTPLDDERWRVMPLPLTADVVATLIDDGLAAVKGPDFDADADNLHAIRVATAGLATGTNVTDARDAVLAKLPAALVAGRIDASVGAMQADVLTGSALAASAVTEIQTGLATSAALATMQGNVTTILGYGAPPTAAANAAAVWATTEGSGTMGASLALLRRRTTNKRHMSGSGVISFYADDGSTVEKTATITDKDGVAITVAAGDPARSSAEA